MKLSTAVVGCLLLAGNASAYNVVIDFEELPLDGNFTVSPVPIETKGFNFSGAASGITYWPFFTEDSQALHWCSGGCYDDSSITLSQDGLAPFDLLSLDLGETSTSSTVNLIGSFVGGGSISTLVSVTTTMTTFLLGAGWSNLESLTIDPAYSWGPAMAVDNIAVVTAVPVPAAVWLFGSALASLCWIRRKYAV
jgi:hypothetical protein